MDLCAAKDIRPNVEIVGVEKIDEVVEILDKKNDTVKRYVLDINKPWWSHKTMRKWTEIGENLEVIHKGCLLISGKINTQFYKNSEHSMLVPIFNGTLQLGIEYILI